jgi:hypothetical protein
MHARSHTGGKVGADMAVPDFPTLRYIANLDTAPEHVRAAVREAFAKRLPAWRAWLELVEAAAAEGPDPEVGALYLVDGISDFCAGLHAMDAEVRAALRPRLAR